MNRTARKIKQTAAGLLVVLSLFVSSVAACICTHHAESTEAKAVSCHEHAESSQNTGETPAAVANLDARDECGCAAPASRAVSKSETIKIEKQAASAPFAALEVKPTARFVSAENAYFEKPFYLSNSLYNLKSPRAPPAA